MILELQILKELQVHFSELQMIKDLANVDAESKGVIRGLFEAKENISRNCRFHGA